MVRVERVELVEARVIPTISQISSPCVADTSPRRIAAEISDRPATRFDVSKLRRAVLAVVPPNFAKRQRALHDANCPHRASHPIVDNCHSHSFIMNDRCDNYARDRALAQRDRTGHYALRGTTRR